jgi:tRNA (Thr-GGU) A37 N-methylase
LYGAAIDRSNRIGFTICKPLSVDGLEIRSSEPDAVDETPVLDVKPYLNGLRRVAKYAHRIGPMN